MTGLNRKSEIYEKVKTFCIFICSLHLVSQSRFSFDLFWGGANLSFGFCKNATVSREKRGPLKSAVLSLGF